jgi:hypothetical protein
MCSVELVPFLTRQTPQIDKKESGLETEQIRGDSAPAGNRISAVQPSHIYISDRVILVHHNGSSL